MPKSAKRAAPVKSSIRSWTWAGLAALLIFSLYSAWNTERLEKEIQIANERAATLLHQRRDLAAQREVAEREATILIDPASINIALAPSDPQAPKLEARWHSQLGIVLTGQRVPVPSGNRVLQLWLIPKTSGGKPIPSLTVRPDAEGKLTLLVANPPELMAATKALAITEEPAGGSPQPTTTPHWVGGVG